MERRLPAPPAACRKPRPALRSEPRCLSFRAVLFDGTVRQLVVLALMPRESLARDHLFQRGKSGVERFGETRLAERWRHGGDHAPPVGAIDGGVQPDVG